MADDILQALRDKLAKARAMPSRMDEAEGLMGAAGVPQDLSPNDQFNAAAAEADTQAALDASTEEGMAIAHAYSPSIPDEPVEPIMSVAPPIEALPEETSMPIADYQDAYEAPPTQLDVDTSGKVTTPKPTIKEDTELKDAIASRDDRLANLQMFKALSQLNAGLARGGKYEEAPWMRGAEETAGRKVSDVGLKTAQASKETQLAEDKIRLERTQEFNDVGSKISAGFYDAFAILAPEIASKYKKGELSAAQINTMVPMAEKILDAKTRSEMKKLASKAKEEETEAKQEVKDADKFSELTDPSRPRNANFGKFQASRVQADKILALVEGKPLGKIDATTVYELARTYESLLSGGVGTITGTLHMIPRNIRADAEKAKAYVAGSLPLAKQEELVKTVLENVKKQKKLYENEIAKTLKLRLSAGAAKRYMDKHPEEVSRYLEENYNLDNDFKPIGSLEELSDSDLDAKIKKAQEEQAKAMGTR